MASSRRIAHTLGASIAMLRRICSTLSGVERSTCTRGSLYEHMFAGRRGCCVVSLTARPRRRAKSVANGVSDVGPKQERRRLTRGGELRLINGELTPVVEGPFELATAKGALVTGDLAGVLGQAVPPFPAPFPIELTLTVERGTKSLAHSTGTIVVVGTWNQLSTDVVGSLSGELTR